MTHARKDIWSYTISSIDVLFVNLIIAEHALAFKEVCSRKLSMSSFTLMDLHKSIARITDGTATLDVSLVNVRVDLLVSIRAIISNYTNALNVISMFASNA